jgi:hypothetical protein
MSQRFGSRDVDSILFGMLHGVASKLALSEAEWVADPTGQSRHRVIVGTMLVAQKKKRV